MRFAALSGRTVSMSGLVRRVSATLVLLAGMVAAMPAGPAGAAVERVEMAGTRFSPARVEIEVGDSVIWEAADGRHTVTARDGSFDSSSRGAMAEGDQYRWRFRIPGTYGYFCRVHQKQGMQGTIVVVDPSAPTTTTARVTPVTAAATTSSTAATTTTTAAPTTTTTRPLATSSTTSMSVATATTEPSGTPLTPQEPPALNPAAPVVGSGADALPEAQAAARRADAEDDPTPYLVAVGLLAVLAAAGAGSIAARRRRAQS